MRLRQLEAPSEQVQQGEASLPACIYSPTSIIRTALIRILDYLNMLKFNDCTSTYACAVGVAKAC